MSVKTAGHAELMEHIHQRLGTSTGEYRRIMEKRNFLPLPCASQRHSQPSRLPGHNFGVLGGGVIKGPAAGAAQSQIAHDAAVVVQNVQRIKAVFRQIALHFPGSGPPVIMVALEQPFLARQAL